MLSENGLEKMSQRKGKEREFKVFKFHSDDRVTNFVLATNLLHTCLIFFEPREGYAFPIWIGAIHVLCFVVYALDVGLKMFYQGWDEYLKKQWQSIYFVMSCGFLIDILWNGHTRWMNALRPSMFTLRSRDSRRFFSVIRLMIPGFLHTCVPIMFFLLVMAMMGVVLFREKKHVFMNPANTMYSLW
jgi:hypothetical protein